MNNSFAKKCRDNNIDCSKAYKFRAKHSDLTDEQIIEYYRNKKTIDYASIRLGERNISLNGLEMELVKYINSHDIDVQFEDGTIVYHKNYTNFKRGYIPHPKYEKAQEAFQYEGKKYFLCKCKTCKRKRVLSLEEMESYICEYCSTQNQIRN